MMMISMKSVSDYTAAVLPAGHHYVEVPLDTLVFFIRKGKAIPFGAAADNTSQIDMSALRLLGYDGSTYELYSDNGYSPEPEDSLKITTL